MMKYTNHLLLMLLISALMGCNDRSKNDLRPSGSHNTATLSRDSLNNSFVNDEIVGWIKLTDGMYNDPAEYIDLHLADRFTMADVNSDGDIDAIGIMEVNRGGSGTFVSLALFLNNNGSAEFADAYLLGDRVLPDSIIVRSDTIHVYYMERSPSEPMSDRGTVASHSILRFDGKKLTELP